MAEPISISQLDLSPQDGNWHERSSRGDHREDHIIDLGMVCLGYPPGPLKATADDVQVAMGADPSIEAGPWRTPIG